MLKPNSRHVMILGGFCLRISFLVVYMYIASLYQQSDDDAYLVTHEWLMLKSFCVV